jgi:hypothetical protein
MLLPLERVKRSPTARKLIIQGKQKLTSWLNVKINA